MTMMYVAQTHCSRRMGFCIVYCNEASHLWLYVSRLCTLSILATFSSCTVNLKNHETQLQECMQYTFNEYKQLQKSTYLGDIMECLSTCIALLTCLTTHVGVHSCMIDTDCMIEVEKTHRNKEERDNRGQS